MRIVWSSEQDRILAQSVDSREDVNELTMASHGGRTRSVLIEDFSKYSRSVCRLLLTIVEVADQRGYTSPGLQAPDFDLVIVS